MNSTFFPDTEVIRLTREGVWLSDGIEIDHVPTRKLFARSIQRDKNGYFLRIGREEKCIEVEDTAYFVQRIDGTVDAGYELLINDEGTVRLDPATLRYRPGRLTCSITRNSGTEEAKFLQAPYFDLLRHLEEDAASYFLIIEGRRVDLSQRGTE